MSQYFDNEFQMIIDHAALTSALQNQADSCRSHCLNDWALYLATFLLQMTIYHQRDTTHSNVDALSCILLSVEYETPASTAQTELERILTTAHCTETTLGFNLKLLQRTCDAISENPAFQKIT